MKPKLFDVGARVIGVRPHGGNSNIVGVAGTVMDASGFCREVRFDEDVKGWSHQRDTWGVWADHNGIWPIEYLHANHVSMLKKEGEQA